MKFSVVFLSLALLAASTAAQTKKPAATKSRSQTVSKNGQPRTAAGTSRKTSPKALPKPAPQRERDEKSEFEAAASTTDPAEKVNSLKKFIVDFPNSEYAGKARESLVVARAVVADERLRAGDPAAGAVMFKLAVEEAPDPMPDRLFSEVISKFPYSLFWNGGRQAALEIAAAIESRAGSNVEQLLAVANFHASTENGAEAMRIAEAALKLDPNSSRAYQTIGVAHRLNFELERSAEAYAKALELDPDSMNSKQSLAEMDRALGKPEEAEKLYREMLATAPDDIPAQTGLVLSLFDAGKRAEAEALMAKALEANPKNVILLAGAAYSYAAAGDPDKAIELAEKAIELEPRYIWSHIALARGYMGKQRPVDAERVLTRARSYGNFPTVEYELASARMAAGFYREAAEDLQKAFSIVDGNIVTRLGGRIERTGSGFGELASEERRASIFTPAGIADAERDLKLKQLLNLHQKMSAAEPDMAGLTIAVDEFTDGSDPMKVHRQLYAASMLLQKDLAHDKILELARAATGNTDTGLDAPNAGAAVMASELYDSRALAFSRNEFLLVPDVPRQTLSAILRGRLEDIAGWTLYQQSKYADAIVRLRRAISVLPDKSAWWRTGMWHLGAALAASGNDKEALEAYIASYKTDKPDLAKYFVVESLYRRVNNGSIDGLEAQLGPDHVVRSVESSEPAPAPVVTETAIPRVTEETAAPAAAASPVSAEQPRLPRGVPVDTSGKVTPIETTPAPRSEPVTEPETGVGNSEAKKAEAAPVESEPAADDAKSKIAEPNDAANDLKDRVTAPAEEALAEKEPAKAEPPVETSVPKTEVEPFPKEPLEKEPAEPAGSLAVPEPVKDPVAEPASKPAEAPTARTLADEPAAPPIIAEPEKEKTSEPPPVIEKAVQDEQPADPNAGRKPQTEQPAKTEVEVRSKPDLSASRSSAPGVKPLFEPIIIPIPVAKPAKKAVDDLNAGGGRPRVIDGVEIKAEEIPPCRIDVSQENVSLINSGGTIGLIVSTDNESALKQLIATTSSPSEVEVKAEPDIEGSSQQRLYIVRSVSAAAGVYQLRFAAACGKRDVIVTVR